MNRELLQKYNVPGPRYTSYPTVPYWDRQTFSPDLWRTSVHTAFLEHGQEGISLYIHLPFCESLCTFCGCNRRITKNHSVEEPYITTLLREWELYLRLLGKPPILREIHLGGGTPTFFHPEKLHHLLTSILQTSEPCDDFYFSFEGHPNNTTFEHLHTLYHLGFRRVSFGVQDYDLAVQTAIHRLQPYEAVERTTSWARQIGYTSVNHDLVYGLPKQTLASMTDTIEKTARLRPDRLAFYSYAHVPWVKGVGQRGFSEDDLPKDAVKRSLYEEGKRTLEDLGYIEIGMDHFALPSDDLYLSMREGRLHRNFMGYTSSKTHLMIGLGVSSISDAWGAFAQNEKEIEAYQARVSAEEIPVFRGHLLDRDDLCIRQHILRLMCQMQTSWTTEDSRFDALPDVLARLDEMENDGLCLRTPEGLTITEAGRPFVRNLCMAFDLRLWQNQPKTQIFSMTI